MSPGVGLVGSSGAETDPEGAETREVTYEELLIRNHFSASSVMFRRACVAGDAVFKAGPECAGVEDWELWLRISREYHGLYALNQIVIIRAVEGSVSSLGNISGLGVGPSYFTHVGAVSPRDQYTGSMM